MKTTLLSLFALLMNINLAFSTDTKKMDQTLQDEIAQMSKKINRNVCLEIDGHNNAQMEAAKARFGRIDEKVQKEISDERMDLVNPLEENLELKNQLFLTNQYFSNKEHKLVKNVAKVTVGVLLGVATYYFLNSYYQTGLMAGKQELEMAVSYLHTVIKSGDSLLAHKESIYKLFGTLPVWGSSESVIISETFKASTVTAQDLMPVMQIGLNKIAALNQSLLSNLAPKVVAGLMGTLVMTHKVTDVASEYIANACYYTTDKVRSGLRTCYRNPGKTLLGGLGVLSGLFLTYYATCL